MLWGFFLANGENNLLMGKTVGILFLPMEKMTNGENKCQ